MMVIDPHSENFLHPQPGFMADRSAHHAGNCYRNNHYLHLARKTTRYASPAARVVPVVSRHDIRVYASGCADEEDPCVEVLEVVIGSVRLGAINLPGDMEGK